ncbi:MAG: zinc ribbon domain-containing protein [Oscillospiraceae bacterium]|nr:zinc ribbon domain-containing protein [Oscillospiraceae bacterium]MBR6561590.1 zinc ribbon domain-containing protein [Oscillospiraceae bacterium]
MKCTSCGTELQENARFCGTCGTKVEAIPAPAPEAAPVPEPTPSFIPPVEPVAAPVEPVAPPVELIAPPVAPVVPAAPVAAPAPVATAAPVYTQPAAPVYPQQMPVQPQQPVDDRRTRVMSTGGYMAALFLMSIPVVGFILQIVWAAGAARNLNRRHLARGYLFLSLIIFAVTVILAVLFAAVFSTGISNLIRYFDGMY